VSWKEYYKQHLMSAQEAAQLVQSGDTVSNPLGLGQISSCLMDAITDRKDELMDVEIFLSLTVKPYKLLRPEYRSTFTIISGFWYGRLLRPIVRSEWCVYIPTQGSDIALKSIRRRKHTGRRHGLVFQAAPPDEHGFINLGLDNFFTESAFPYSDYLIVEINPQMPRTYGSTSFHVSTFHAFVEHAEPIPAQATPEPSPAEIEIAKHVTSLLRDRDCIQVGIGGVPAMISKLLESSGLKDLGIHSELVPIGTDRLVEKGVVTGKYKKTHPGKVIAAFAPGNKELYDFVGNNPLCEIHSAAYVNYPFNIAREDNVVAVNGSIEVDLTGQIVSESIGNTMVSGSGGQLDFAIGACWSPGGRAINVLPSTSRDGKISRIVPYITQGSRVTVPRHYAGYVVTEYGVADVYGLTEPERAEALIKIAHPKFREELEKGARERGLLKKKTFPSSATTSAVTPITM